MITQFRVKNYKALVDVALDLTPVHVLIGPNDSGKTSLLEAIAALCRSVDLDLSHAFAGPWDGAALVTRHDPALPVMLGVTMVNGSTIDYELACRFAASGRRVAIELEKINVAKRTHDLDSRGNHATRVQLTQVEGRLPYDDEQQAPTDSVYRALSGVHYYRWNPKLMALPVAPDSKRQFRMDESGFGLTLVLDDILGYDRDRFTALEDRFRDIFPQVKSIKLVRQMGYTAPIDSSRPVPMLQQADGKGLCFEFTSNGSPVAASQVSDGMLLVLAYLTLLHLPKPPRVILVEEPENGIHPNRLQDVLRILRSLVEGQAHSQVIITTHSPYVLDLFKPEEVSLCRKQEGGVQVHRLSESKTVQEQLDVFTLGEIWTAEGDERISSTVAPQRGSGR